MKVTFNDNTEKEVPQYFKTGFGHFAISCDEKNYVKIGYNGITHWDCRVLDIDIREEIITPITKDEFKLKFLEVTKEMESILN